MTTPFPDNNEYTGFNAPMRLEFDLNDCVVEGKIPDEINGNWYQLTSDPMYPPKFDDENFFNGDGIVTKFAFHNGKVDYKLRYVQTDRLTAEQEAGHALFGRYRNPYTDDPSVKGVKRGVVNTTPVWHGGKLLGLKEDDLAMELDPHTLETKGWWDFGGKWTSETMTAHPRLDFDTGEMFIFGYEAAGLATRDVALGVVNKAGELVKEEWFQVPYDSSSWMHDFAVTKDYIIFPCPPTNADLEGMKEGGPHWKWHPEKPTWVGVMPRNGSVKDMRWFKGPGLSFYHFMNAFNDGEKAYLDLSYCKDHQFPFVRKDTHGTQDVNPEDMMVPYMRWEFDMSKPGDTWNETVLCGVPGADFPRVADKDHMKDYDIGYMISYVPDNGPPCMIGIAHMGFNTLSRVEIKTGKVTQFSFGPGTTIAEPIHVPSKKEGHEGYLILGIHLHDEFLSDVAVFEAEHIDKGPIARVKLPIRFRHQTHGCWVSGDQLP